MRYLLVLFAAIALHAQEVRVYSEFRRVDAHGEVIKADAAGTPREILSPVVPRNAYSSFRVVMLLPAGSDVWFEIGQNPENAVRVTLYEESADGTLREVAQPYKTKLTGNATAASLWMDIWVPPDAEPGRIKLEPQLYYPERWFTYPMEARIVDAVVPKVTVTNPGTPPAGASADWAVRATLLEQLCGAPAADGKAAGPSIWTFTRRNTLQDLALAGKRPFVAPGWCKAPADPNPEWYLRVRDAIYRSATGGNLR